MAQRGSRLFFFVLGDDEEVTEEDLIAVGEGKLYMDRPAECKFLVHEVLTKLFGRQPKQIVVVSRFKPTTRRFADGSPGARGC